MMANNREDVMKQVGSEGLSEEVASETGRKPAMRKAKDTGGKDTIMRFTGLLVYCSSKEASTIGF